MTKLFISYRRADSQETADRLHDQMTLHFGDANVFQDVLDIPLGVDFRRYIRDAVGRCQAVLVVIGTEWLRLIHERQDDPDDFVRLEIETALALGKLVVPVTVRGAQMPKAQDLPEPIRPLCWLNRAVVRPNPDFKRDCERLAHGIRAALGETPPTPDNPLGESLNQALARAGTFDSPRNHDWVPYDTTFSHLALPDLRFCLVPVGSFSMGSRDHADERPTHPQTFNAPFWIGQTPITNAQWRQAVEAGAVEPPTSDKARIWYRDPTLVNAPVVGVTWAQAHRFCEWLGVRLPSEREWEYAARGVEGWAYPWGDVFEVARVVHESNSLGRPWDVAEMPDGASWVGARHMAGNVWEWTASAYDAYPYPPNGERERAPVDLPRTLRGGSWMSKPKDTRSAFRIKAVAEDWFVTVDGFRCALG
jgi:hypothetical protein